MNRRQITTVPHVQVDDTELTDPTYMTTCKQDLERRAARLAHIHADFWKRYEQEYLPALMEYHKVKGRKYNVIKVGDVVLVHSDSNRVKWNLAVVKRLNYGQDGLVRSAEIKTQNGFTNRPIARLYPLEVSSTEDNEPTLVDNTREDVDNTQNNTRVPRAAALAAKDRIKLCYL